MFPTIANAYLTTLEHTALQGVTVELQATDRDELGEEGLMARIRDSMTRR